METPKLVTVTRTDIPEGYQAVQSTHAAIDFVFEHPTRAGPWHTDSNTLVMLTTKDEKGLKHLMRKCDYLSLCYTVFREPDIGNQITAICIEPHPEVYKMVSKLPLLMPKTEENEQENNGYQSKVSQLTEDTNVPESEGKTSLISNHETRVI